MTGNTHVDLGCGYGRTLIFASRSSRPKVAVGIDISRVMLRKAAEYAQRYGVEVVLLRADITSLPLSDSAVDSMYLSGVLIHLPKDKVAAVVREVARALRPGGCCTLEVSFLGWLNPAGLQTKIVTSLLSSRLRPAWVRTYTHREVIRLIERAARFGRVDLRPEGYVVLPKTSLSSRSRVQFGRRSSG